MNTLTLRMTLITILFFGIIYIIISFFFTVLGVSNLIFYLVFALIMVVFQYLMGPKLVEWMMHVRYIKEEDEPLLYSMVKELAEKAKIPMPKVGISYVPFPNAFAFGRWLTDSRVCVTKSIMEILSPEELKAVLGHEISHIKNRDVLFITFLSVIPLICYRIAFHYLFYGSFASRRRENSYPIWLVGLTALFLYFITNLFVLYASRIREYFADRGSMELGNPPNNLASALYKLVYASAYSSKDKVRAVEGMKAFFINDPSRSKQEIKEIYQLDIDKSGTIDKRELEMLKEADIKLSFEDRLLELLTTHPNMLKRIKFISMYDNKRRVF